MLGNLEIKGNIVYIDGIKSNFLIQELVPKRVFEHFGVNCVWFLDYNTVKTLQNIRDYFDAPIKVNDYYKGGYLQYRGYRDDNFYYKFTGNKTYKSVKKGKFSQHRLAKAFDLNIQGLTSDQVREDIIEKESLFMSFGVTTIEDGFYSPSWLHFDTRITNLDKIKIVKP